MKPNKIEIIKVECFSDCIIYYIKIEKEKEPVFTYEIKVGETNWEEIKAVEEDQSEEGTEPRYEIKKITLRDLESNTEYTAQIRAVNTKVVPSENGDPSEEEDGRATTKDYPPNPIEEVIRELKECINYLMTEAKIIKTILPEWLDPTDDEIDELPAIRYRTYSTKPNRTISVSVQETVETLTLPIDIVVRKLGNKDIIKQVTQINTELKKIIRMSESIGEYGRNTRLGDKEDYLSNLNDRRRSDSLSDNENIRFYIEVDIIENIIYE